MRRWAGQRCCRSVIVGPIDHDGQRSRILDKGWKLAEGGPPEVLVAVVSRVIAVVAVARPSLSHDRRDEVVARRMAEGIREVEAIGQAIAGERSGESHAQPPSRSV